LKSTWQFCVKVVYSMLAYRWDNVHLTAKITLFFVRFWPAYDVIRKLCYSQSEDAQIQEVWTPVDKWSYLNTWTHTLKHGLKSSVVARPWRVLLDVDNAWSHDTWATLLTAAWRGEVYWQELSEAQHRTWRDNVSPASPVSDERISRVWVWRVTGTGITWLCRFSAKLGRRFDLVIAWNLFWMACCFDTVLGLVILMFCFQSLTV